MSKQTSIKNKVARLLREKEKNLQLIQELNLKNSQISKDIENLFIQCKHSSFGLKDFVNDDRFFYKYCNDCLSGLGTYAKVDFGIDPSQSVKDVQIDLEFID